MRFAMNWAMVALMVVLSARVPALAQTAEPPPAPPPATRTVSVQVTVTKEGQPWPGVGVRFPSSSHASQNTVAVTNAQGQAVLTGPISLTRTRLGVLTCIPPNTTNRAEASGVLRAMHRDYTFRNTYPVSLAPGVGTYELAIDVVPAVKSTMSFVDAAGVTIGRSTIIPGDAGALSTWEYSGSPSAGIRIVGGLRRGVAERVFYLSEVGQVHPITVGPFEHDAVVPPITIIDSPGEVPMHLTVTGALRYVESEKTSLWGVTLVRVDGQLIRTLLFQSQTDPAIKHFVDRAHPDELPRMPAGEYYVTGSVFDAREAQVRLIDRAKAGENLRPLGVPTITLTPGQTTAAELDLSNVEDILLAPQASPSGQ